MRNRENITLVTHHSKGEWVRSTQQPKVHSTSDIQTGTHFQLSVFQRPAILISSPGRLSEYYKPLGHSNCRSCACRTLSQDLHMNDLDCYSQVKSHLFLEVDVNNLIYSWSLPLIFSSWNLPHSIIIFTMIYTLTYWMLLSIIKYQEHWPCFFLIH